MRHSFDSDWGRFAVEWSPRGITRLEFPPARRAGKDEPPEFVKSAIAEVRAYVAGSTTSFRAPVDLDGLTPFTKDVYAALRRIPPGKTLTYGELAARAGRPGAARAVGSALRRNPVPLLVPCHRVLAAGGRLGGFSAPGGTATKKRLLELEGRRDR